MDINHSIEANVPVAYVYEKISDVNTLATSLPSNVVMRSESGHDSLIVGSRWIIRAQRTGRNFVINSEVTEVELNRKIAFKSASNRILSKSKIILEELDAERTKVTFSTTLSPKGLLGRILIQSLKASRGRVETRLNASGQRIVDFLEDGFDGK